MRDSCVRKDRRNWREVLRDYNSRPKPVTLPRLKFLEEKSDEEERERAAA